LADLDQQAGYVASELARQFDEVKPEQYIYPRLVSIAPYGAIKSVSWNVGEGGINTVVSVGVEEIRPFVPTYNERLNQTKTITLHWPSGVAVKDEYLKKENIRRSGGI